MYADRLKNKLASKYNELMSNKYFARYAKNYEFNGYKRIYNVHIRKTGGTSLNNMFLALSGADSSVLFTQLVDKPEHRACVNDLIYVGWNKSLINKGDYFYAFSHIPYHKLKLKEDTFTLTCFRDPVKRIVSHYFMLLDFVNRGVKHPSFAVEEKWLGNSFDDFYNNMPKEHLFNQLYMFSNKIDVGQALNNLNKISHVMVTEDFTTGVEGINSKLGLKLQSLHIRKSPKKNIIEQSSLDDLREVLDKEYKFLSMIQEKM